MVSTAFLFILLLAVIPSQQQVQPPRITIQQGTLVGKVMSSRQNNTIFAFQGIPYAEPPIGDLRFRDPIAHRGWKGERLAKTEGNDCPQFNVTLLQSSGSEDCLFLNVYSPNIRARGLPVMVWIHGGGMVLGSGSTYLYGPEFLLDQNVVLVTLNYRLGILGLLNLGTAEVHGNYALRDQVVALQWVRQNIASFGGNPDSVTIFGFSAGSASVHYLLLSPLSRGLFHRAIMESGCAFNNWAYLPEADKVSARAVESLGCGNGSGTAALDCLRKIEPAKFQDEANAVAVRERRRDPFGVSLDPPYTTSPFLPSDPANLYMADVPIMAGVSSHEGIVNMFYLKPLDLNKELGENRDYYIPRDLNLRRNTTEFENAWKQISDFYKTLPGDETDQYILMATDSEYAFGVDTMVRRGACSKRKSPMYYFQFSYQGSVSRIKGLVPTNRTGAAHGDELGYLFARPNPNFRDLPAKDQAAIDRMSKLWTNFAKTGNPTPDTELGVKWLPVDRSCGNNPENLLTRYMDLGEKLEMRNESLNGRRMQLWSNLRRAMRGSPRF